MLKLSALGLESDIELRKKLYELIELKKEIEHVLERDIDDPMEEENYKNTLLKVDELIGKIRFHGLDEAEVL